MLVASGSWCLPINLLIPFPRSNSLPLILHLSKSSFQTPQRALSDRITSPSHLNISSVYALLLPQNAFIKVNKNLLIMRSKEKKSPSFLEFSAVFDNVDYFLPGMPRYLGCPGNPPRSCLSTSLRFFLLFAFVTCSHLDWFLTGHCNSWSYPGPWPILSLVISLIFGLPITLWVAMALGQDFQSNNLFLSSRPRIQVPAGLHLLWPWPLGCIWVHCPAPHTGSPCCVPHTQGPSPHLPRADPDTRESPSSLPSLTWEWIPHPLFLGFSYYEFLIYFCPSSLVHFGPLYLSSGPRLSTRSLSLGWLLHVMDVSGFGLSGVPHSSSLPLLLVGKCPVL